VPTYQYACTECGDPLEQVQKFTDDPLTVCPACGGKLRKLFSSVGIVFKGSGFYRTDSRSAAAVGAKASEGGSSGEATSSSGSSEPSGSGASKDASGSNGSSGSGSSGDSKGTSTAAAAAPKPAGGSSASGGSKSGDSKSGGSKSGGSKSAADS